MALVIADRVRETTTSTGVGNISLAGPYTGFQALSVIGNGNSTYYAIIEPNTGSWEVGIGTYSTAGNALSRDTVLASSNSGSLVNFGPGVKDVIITQPSERAVFVQSAGSGLQTGVAAFTSNGIPYANTTSTLTTGSALTFNGTNLSVSSVTVGPGAGAISTNTVVGNGALPVNTTGYFNTVMGNGALASNTTGNQNTALGYLAANAITTQYGVVAVGSAALLATTASLNTAVGTESYTTNSTGAQNTGIGYRAGYLNTTGSDNTAVGFASLRGNSTGILNVAVGSNAMRVSATGNYNTATGAQALYNGVGSDNTAVGFQAGYNTSGLGNTFVGSLSGVSMTTGSKNTILGRFSGNQAGLDITAANNFIVLSDGDGNPRGVFDASGNLGIGTTSPTAIGSSRVVEIGATTGNSAFQLFSVAGTLRGSMYANASEASVGSISAIPLLFKTNDTERARIDTSGNLNILANKLAMTGLSSGQQVYNYNFLAAGGAVQNYKIATLPISTDGTYDHIKIEGVFDAGWGSGNKTPFLITAGNRGGLTVRYLYGSYNFPSHIDFYTEGDGSVSVWAVLDASSFTILTFNVTSGTQIINYLNPANGTPTGTLSWSSKTTYPNIDAVPSQIVFNTNNNFSAIINSSGNFGIGTSSPNARLSIGDTSTTTSNQIRLHGPASGTAGGASINVVNGTNTIFAAGNASNIIGGSYSSDGMIFWGNAALRFYGNSAERMRIDSGGEVYIAGTTDQGAYNLQVNGTGVWGAGAYVNGSDARLKENVQTLTDGLSVVTQLRPVTFQYKASYSKDTAVQPGFIAQELKQVLDGKIYADGVVHTGPQHLNVAYQSLIPVLTAAIQELKAELDSVKAELATLKGN